MAEATAVQLPNGNSTSQEHQSRKTRTNLGEAPSWSDEWLKKLRRMKRRTSNFWTQIETPDVSSERPQRRPRGPRPVTVETNENHGNAFQIPGANRANTSTPDVVPERLDSFDEIAGDLVRDFAQLPAKDNISEGETATFSDLTFTTDVPSSTIAAELHLPETRDENLSSQGASQSIPQIKTYGVPETKASTSTGELNGLIRDNREAAKLPAIGLRQKIEEPKKIQTDQLQDHEDEELLFEQSVGPFLEGLCRHKLLAGQKQLMFYLDSATNAAAGRLAGTRTRTIIVVCSGRSALLSGSLHALLSSSDIRRGLQGFSVRIEEGPPLAWMGPYSADHNQNPDKSLGMTMQISPPKDSTTLCGAPIKMIVSGYHESVDEVAWTCGGLVYVDGRMCGLTTAHPLLQARKTKMLEPEFTRDLLTPDPCRWHPWRVSGPIPSLCLPGAGALRSNNDWLLFEVGQNNQLPNALDGKWISDIWAQDRSKDHQVTMQTSHGSIQGVLNPTISFLILDDCSFRVAMLNLRDPMRYGDSGSWVVEKGALVGVVIAASEDCRTAFVLHIKDLLEAISEHSGFAEVRLPSRIENEIMAVRATKREVEMLEDLLPCLLLKHSISDISAISVDSSWRRASSELITTSLDPEVVPFLHLGSKIALTDSMMQWAWKHPGKPVRLAWTKSAQLVRNLRRFRYGNYLILFINSVREAITTLDSHKTQAVTAADNPEMYIATLLAILFQKVFATEITLPCTDSIVHTVRTILRQTANGNHPRALATSVPNAATTADVLAQLWAFDATTSVFIYNGPNAQWFAKFQPYTQRLHPENPGYAFFDLQATHVFPRAFFIETANSMTGHGVTVVRDAELTNSLKQYEDYVLASANRQYKLVDVYMTVKIKPGVRIRTAAENKAAENRVATGPKMHLAPLRPTNTWSEDPSEKTLF